MNPRESLAAHSYVILATLSTVSLAVISVSLLPVAKWAMSQNECIERTYRTTVNNAGIPTKVWSCNGGGD